jgi:uncharacterized RDD family membrane protein YckC
VSNAAEVATGASQPPVSFGPEAVAPSLRRRLCCLVYEGVLLFGLVMMAALVYSVVTNQRHALVGQRGLQVWLFLVIGVYLVGFWTRQGQTLPMKTWHMQLVDDRGLRPGLWRCVMRYVLSWMWFLPALLALSWSSLRGWVPFTVVLLSGIAAYAVIARLHPTRQFLHDILCRTRLVDTRRSGQLQA